MATFTARMETAALYQLRNAFAQGKDADGCIAFATASMAREQEALCLRVCAKHFDVADPV